MYSSDITRAVLTTSVNSRRPCRISFQVTTFARIYKVIVPLKSVNSSDRMDEINLYTSEGFRGAPIWGSCYVTADNPP